MPNPESEAAQAANHYIGPVAAHCTGEKSIDREKVLRYIARDNLPAYAPTRDFLRSAVVAVRDRKEVKGSNNQSTALEGYSPTIP
jgi:hypothetical protein